MEITICCKQQPTYNVIQIKFNYMYRLLQKLKKNLLKSENLENSFISIFWYFLFNFLVLILMPDFLLIFKVL